MNNEYDMPRKENILFELDQLIAKNQTSLSIKQKIKESDIWDLDCKNVNVFWDIIIKNI